MDSVNFFYGGVSSEDMGLSLIKTESGMISEPFMADREIISETIPHNDTPYIFGWKKNPFKLSLKFSPLNGFWTSEYKSQVARWFDNGKFNIFYSYDDIDRQYFLSYIGSPELSTNGLKQGWISVDFINIDCYVRSPVYQEIFDLSTIGSTTVTKTLTNSGDEKVFIDEMRIKKHGAGTVKIKNLSDGGKTFEMSLEDGEIATIYNQERIIESSIPQKLLYDDFNGNYFSLVYGINTLEITSPCELEFKYRCLFKTG